MKKYQLYCLYSLQTLIIRYIGITSQPNLKTRLYQHLKIKNKNSYKDNWINSCNNKIGIKMLRNNLSKEIAREFEIDLIQKHKEKHKLVNLQDRGLCGDRIKLSSEKCLQISNTLKNKYQNKEILIKGEKPVFVFGRNGNLISKYQNTSLCAKELGIPYSKVGTICRKGGYYKDFTFSRNNEIPLKNYIKVIDTIEKKVYLFFKKEQISFFLKVRNASNFYSKYDKNSLYKKRFLIKIKDNNINKSWITPVPGIN